MNVFFEGDSEITICYYSNCIYIMHPQNKDTITKTIMDIPSPPWLQWEIYAALVDPPKIASYTT